MVKKRPKEPNGQKAADGAKWSKRPKEPNGQKIGAVDEPSGE